MTATGWEKSLEEWMAEPDPEEDEEEIDIYSRLKEIADNLTRYLHKNDLNGQEDFEKIRNQLDSDEFVCQLRERYWDPIFEIRNDVEELVGELMENIDV